MNDFNGYLFTHEIDTHIWIYNFGNIRMLANFLLLLKSVMVLASVLTPLDTSLRWPKGENGKLITTLIMSDVRTSVKIGKFILDIAKREMICQ